MLVVCYFHYAYSTSFCNFVPSHGVDKIETSNILYNSSSPNSRRKSGKNLAIFAIQTKKNNKLRQDDVISISRFRYFLVSVHTRRPSTVVIPDVE